MKTVLRWRFALCLFALVALVHPAPSRSSRTAARRPWPTPP
ncbi:MAG: hypothetical protein U0325_09975 [Polyangiales bacterium]